MRDYILNFPIRFYGIKSLNNYVFNVQKGTIDRMQLTKWKNLLHLFPCHS